MPTTTPTYIDHNTTVKIKKLRAEVNGQVHEAISIGGVLIGSDDEDLPWVETNVWLVPAGTILAGVRVAAQAPLAPATPAPATEGV